MSRNNPESHKDLLKRSFQREESGGVARYVYVHDDKYYFVLAACTRLDLDFEAKSDRLIVPADVFEDAVLGGATVPVPVPESESASAPSEPVARPAVAEPVVPQAASNFAKAEEEMAKTHFAQPLFANEDVAYEEEEFVFSAPEQSESEDNDSDAGTAVTGSVFAPAAPGASPSPFIVEEDAEEEAEAPLQAVSHPAPVFMTHRFVEDGKGDVPSPPMSPPTFAGDDEDSEEEEFVFMPSAGESADDEDDLAELKWDDSALHSSFDVEDEYAVQAQHEFAPATLTEESHSDTAADAFAGAGSDDQITEIDFGAEADQAVVFDETEALLPEPEIAKGAAPAVVPTPVPTPVALPQAPQLSIAEVQEHAFKKRTEGLNAREQALLDRERAVSDREHSVVAIEDDIEERRKEISRRDRRIERRRKDLDALERKLKARQTYLDSQRDQLEGLKRHAREMMEG